MMASIAHVGTYVEFPWVVGTRVKEVESPRGLAVSHLLDGHTGGGWDTVTGWMGSWVFPA